MYRPTVNSIYHSFQNRQLKYSSRMVTIDRQSTGRLPEEYGMSCGQASGNLLELSYSDHATNIYSYASGRQTNIA